MSVALITEGRVKIHENKMQRRIFGSKKVPEGC
jgi:hypothetical protein